MSKEGENSRGSGWNRRFIEEQFGKETADKLRCILMKIWRTEKPTLPSERPEHERGNCLVKWQLGLAAIYAEAEDPRWATKLSEDEARLAARYYSVEFSGIPNWMESLVAAYPSAVDSILGEELSWDLGRNSNNGTHSLLLQSIGYASSFTIKLFLPRLMAWLSAKNNTLEEDGELIGVSLRLRRVIDILLDHGGENERTQILSIACRNLEENFPIDFNFVWLSALMRVNAGLGVSHLEEILNKINPEMYSEAVSWFSALFGDSREAISLRSPKFTADLLLRLCRLVYRHVRPSEDAKHEGAYTPDVRDNAEHARNEIVKAIFELTGENGWAAKMEVAKDPVCAHFKDRIIAIAEEHWAEEMDSDVFNEEQAHELDTNGEAPPTTNAMMFEILCDRLADLDDLLLRDLSPRENWANISEERIMRREIARELHNLSKGLYKVDQEAVTADEKETDIRLRSVASDHEAVIELKLAEKKRTARELIDAINKQLVSKYMASENSRSGCLLITIAKNRKWDHPDTNQRIGIAELESLLRDEAKKIERSLAGSISISVHILDLRPRLNNEGLSAS